MGCDFYYEGALANPLAQERVIAFVRSYYTEPDRILMPQPDVRYPTIVNVEKIDVEKIEEFCGRRLTNFDREYPFNFYGLIPFCRPGFFVDDGQWVFDRNDGGRLVRFLKLPGGLEVDHYPAARFAADHPGEEIACHVIANGSNRDRVGFDLALMAIVIKMRWWPDLQVTDDYGNCEDVENKIQEYGLTQALRDGALDFPACLELVEAEYRARRPPVSRAPTLKVFPDEFPRKVDLAILDWPVAEQNFSVRTQRVLKGAGILTIRNLLRYTAVELRKQPYCGRKSIDEMVEFLGNLGLCLPGSGEE